jgi:hypothetical protein
MNMTRSDMEGKPSHIEAHKGHKPPKAISETPPASVPKHRPRTKQHTLLSQIAYRETLPKDQRGRMIVDEWPFDAPMPDFVEIRKPLQEKQFLPILGKAKQTIKDNIMNAILTRIWAFVRDVILQWAFPFPIYRKGEDGVTPIRDDKGKHVIDWVATVSARVLSLVAVVWGTVEVLGIPLAEWIARLAGALGIPIGG